MIHSKILDRKATANHTNFLSTRADNDALNDRHSLLDDRIVEGYAVIWDNKNSHHEVFKRGSFTKSILDMGVDSNSAFKIKFRHEHGEVICLFEELKEDEIGLYFRTVPLPAGDVEDSILRKLRDETYNNFSIGFRYIWDANKMRYDEGTDTIYIYEAMLLEISVVGIPSDMSTFAIRSQQDMLDLFDDTEDFILSLPRKNQFDARSMFAKYKSLYTSKQLEHEERKTLTEVVKPTEKQELDFDYILSKI